MVQTRGQKRGITCESAVSPKRPRYLRSDSITTAADTAPSGECMTHRRASSSVDSAALSPGLDRDITGSSTTESERLSIDSGTPDSSLRSTSPSDLPQSVAGGVEWDASAILDEADDKVPLAAILPTATNLDAVPHNDAVPHHDTQSTIANTPCDEKEDDPEHSPLVLELVSDCLDKVQQEVPRHTTQGAPPAWAERRQSLNESLPWYRASQGSMYTKDKVLVGLMLGKEGDSSNVLQSQVIITSVGGGRKKDVDGICKRTLDIPSNNRYVEAARNAMVQNVPVGVVIHKEHAQLRVHLQHEYNVLAWFHVTDVWPERALVHYAKDDVTISPMFWKFRLERINLIEDCWMAPTGFAAQGRHLPGQHVVKTRTCSSCGHESNQIFSQIDGWTCLTPSCADFFRFPDNTGADLSLLTYGDAFVNQRTAFTGRAPGPLVGDVVALSPQDDQNFGTELAFRSGGVCPKCGCCASRKHWDLYSCENAGCGYQCKLPLRAVPLPVILDENANFHRRTTNNMTHQGLTGRHDGVVKGYTYQQWLIPGPDEAIIGSITILRCSDEARGTENGPNDLWERIQGEDHNLCRNAVRHAGLSTEVVTRHFAGNFGAPYKFAVSVRSKSFKEAPETVLRTRARLSWAGQACIDLTRQHLAADNSPTSTHLSLEFTPFNELLSLGYRETDSISFHDDGEDTLGPTVGTLSLGSPSTMVFRVKPRQSLLGIPKVEKAEKCRSVKDPKEDDEGGPSGSGRNVLAFVINHGDMVVMHGTEIHRYYDHMVKPDGIRRYALTCRYIRPETLSPGVREAAAEMSELPAHAAGWTYDGN